MNLKPVTAGVRNIKKDKKKTIKLTVLIEISVMKF